MSAVEVIEQIKALPAEEKAKVAEFLRGFDSQQTESKVMEDGTFYKAADAVFSKHDELLRKLAQ